MSYTTSAELHGPAVSLQPQIHLPEWDILFSKSRPLLAAVLNTVLTEAAQAYGKRLLGGSTSRAGAHLAVLVRAYTIGVFNSEDIAHEGTVCEHWPEWANLTLSAAELRRFRRSHRSLLVHCLARMYWLAWHAILSDSFAAADGPSDWMSCFWAHAVRQAEIRVEWACFSDLAERE